MSLSSLHVFLAFLSHVCSLCLQAAERCLAWACLCLSAVVLRAGCCAIALHVAASHSALQNSALAQPCCLGMIL